MDHLDEAETEHRPLTKMRSMIASEDIHCGHGRGGPEVCLRVREGPHEEEGEEESGQGGGGALDQEHVCHIHEVEDGGQEKDREAESGEDVTKAVHPKIHTTAAH